MIEELVKLDTDLFIYLNNLGTKTWDSFWIFYTTKTNWIPFYVILAYLLYKRLNTKMFVLTLLVVALMITFTDQITNIFKNVLIQRDRPCYNSDIDGLFRLVKSYCGGQYGYFSGHASNAMAVAVFTSLMLKSKYKYIALILIPWAIAMGYSRIYIGVHYPLDVATGMLFGGLSGFMFYKLDKYLQSRFRLR